MPVTDTDAVRVTAPDALNVVVAQVDGEAVAETDANEAVALIVAEPHTELDTVGVNDAELRGDGVPLGLAVAVFEAALEPDAVRDRRPDVLATALREADTGPVDVRDARAVCERVLPTVRVKVERGLGDAAELADTERLAIDDTVRRDEPLSVRDAARVGLDEKLGDVLPADELLDDGEDDGLRERLGDALDVHDAAGERDGLVDTVVVDDDDTVLTCVRVGVVVTVRELHAERLGEEETDGDLVGARGDSVLVRVAVTLPRSVRDFTVVGLTNDEGDVVREFTGVRVCNEEMLTRGVGVVEPEVETLADALREALTLAVLDRAALVVAVTRDDGLATECVGDALGRVDGDKEVDGECVADFRGESEPVVLPTRDGE